ARIDDHLPAGNLHDRSAQPKHHVLEGATLPGTEEFRRRAVEQNQQRGESLSRDRKVGLRQGRQIDTIEPAENTLYNLSPELAVPEPLAATARIVVREGLPPDKPQLARVYEVVQAVEHLAEKRPAAPCVAGDIDAGQS